MFDLLLYTLERLTSKVKRTYTGSMVEKDFQTLWGKYLMENPPQEPEAHELKLCKVKTFPFNNVKDHQIKGLLEASSGLYHRIYDQPWVANGFQPQKPFDCMWIKGTRGYVVICFYEPRRYKKVFKIPIDQFISLRDTWPRKSIRLDQLELQFKPIEL